MTDSDSKNGSLSSPTLVAPCDSTVVNGQEVVFAWSASPEADGYRLQVAETARFKDLRLDADVGLETAVTVGNQLPTDGQTFFWRVVAQTEAGDEVHSAVESFVAGTADESEQDLLEPEAAGPEMGLARADTPELPAQVLQGEDQFEQEKERGVAYEGIAASQIMAIALSILVVILVAVVVLFNWYGQVSQEAKANAVDSEDYELLRRAEMEAQEDLTRYEVVDEEEGVYRIPIDQAMDLIATEEYERAASDAEEAATAEEDESPAASEQ